MLESYNIAELGTCTSCRDILTLFKANKLSSVALPQNIFVSELNVDSELRTVYRFTDFINSFSSCLLMQQLL